MAITMQYKTLNTGAKMPMLGLGVYGILESSIPVLSAFEAGYRSIDTAFGYGNEDIVGRAFNESGLKREDVFITTKLSNGAQREGRVAAEFEQSLANLGMDYVDLYLMHWPVQEHYVDTWLTMEKIYQSGRAKAIGVSNWQDYHIERVKKVWNVVPAVNQVEMHPYLTQNRCLRCARQRALPPSLGAPWAAAIWGM